MLILPEFYTTIDPVWAYHDHDTCMKIMDFWENDDFRHKNHTVYA
jgi:hypothetical protein